MSTFTYTVEGGGGPPTVYQGFKGAVSSPAEPGTRLVVIIGPETRLWQLDPAADQADALAELALFYSDEGEFASFALHRQTFVREDDEAAVLGAVGALIEKGTPEFRRALLQMFIRSEGD